MREKERGGDEKRGRHTVQDAIRDEGEEESRSHARAHWGREA